MRSLELVEAALVAVRDCALVREGEQVVVIADALHPAELTTALGAAARALGADVAVITMPKPAVLPARENWEPSLWEPMPAVAAALREADAAITLVNPYLLGTRAQEEALAGGTRVFSLMYYDRFRHRTQMSPDEIVGDFIRMMSADIPAMDALTERVAQALDGARVARLTAPGGTDLVIEQRPGNRAAVLGGVVRTLGDTYGGVGGGCWAHSPGGVAGIVPATANGVLVCDVSMVPLGRVRHPIRFTIEDRRIVGIEGGDADWLRAYLDAFGDGAVYTCPAEWGLGTNPAAIPSGKFLEEEVVYGTPHVALGDDTRFHNGGNFAPFHSDVMVRGASLELDGELVLDRGEFRL